MTTGIKELKLWQEAVALGGDVVHLARQSARRETRALSDQLMHTAVAVASGVAEGYAGHAPEEQRRCYLRARRDLAQLETQLAIARHGGLLTAATLAQLSTRTGAVSRLLGGYLAFLDRQLAVTGGTDGAAGVTASPPDPLPGSAPVPA